MPRERKKGRAMGRIITGIKKSIKEENKRITGI